MKSPSLLLLLPVLLLSACSTPGVPASDQTTEPLTGAVTTPVAPVPTAPTSTSPVSTAPVTTTPDTALDARPVTTPPKVTTVKAYTDAQLLDMLGQLRVEQVEGTTLPLAGAYRIAPAGRINWYFANLGLRHFVDAQPIQIRDYLTTYIAFTRATSPTYRIHDVNFTDAYTPAGAELVEPDSDDAYAGTFLSLAAAYVTQHHDQDWLAHHRDDLLSIARANITSTLKTSGLPTVFQNAAQGGGVSYLMDACEAYDGLNALAALLEAQADPPAPELRAAATRTAQGIAGLYDEQQNRWKVADVPGGLGSGSGASGLYPLATAQVFAGVYAVPGRTPRQTTQRAAAGWKALNTLAPQWYASTQYDAFPWVMLSYAATTQGQTNLALQHLEFVTQNYAYRNGRFTINELGFFRATQQAITRQMQASGQQIIWDGQ